MTFRFLIIINVFSYYVLQADCSDLTYEECIYWSGYCEWNEETGLCQNLAGGGGDDDDIQFGPYQFDYLTEADSIRQSDLYNRTLLYYPLDANPPFSSIVLIDAFGDEFGLQRWAR